MNSFLVFLTVFSSVIISHSPALAQRTTTPKTNRIPDASEIILRSGQDTSTSSQSDSADSDELTTSSEVALHSVNRKVTVKFDDSADLVIVRKCDNVILWKQVVVGLGTRIVMESNGNLVVYRSSPELIAWQSNTAGNPGADLRLQDDGHLCVFKAGRCIWSNGRPYSAPCDAQLTYHSPRLPSAEEADRAETVIPSGQKLRFGHDEILSQNGSVGLKIAKNEDGLEILSVYRKCDGETVWRPEYTKTFNPEHQVKLIMQRDGNLVIYGTDEDEAIGRNAYWACGHYSHFSGANVKLFDDGLLCVAKDGESCLWSSKKHLINVKCSNVSIEDNPSGAGGDADTSTATTPGRRFSTRRPQTTTTGNASSTLPQFLIIHLATLFAIVLFLSRE